jgi:endogenous inhibitor of DNA gyrase (YacG/DUF329 family)
MPKKPTGTATPPHRARPCPICFRPSTPEHHPFCSDRCRDRDLHRWLSGSYAIPVIEEDGAETDEDES